MIFYQVEFGAYEGKNYSRLFPNLLEATRYWEENNLPVEDPYEFNFLNEVSLPPDANEFVFKVINQ